MIAGRYTLVEEIGRGGMGAVWLGHDEVLDRSVALKRIGLLPGADTTDLARAEREARLAARLSHPHIVAVLNVVADGDTDARWLVMEYVDGSTLAHLVRAEGGLAPDEATPLLWQAADALVAAHAAGIVHRDVKPSNILVDRTGRVKLTDFGIARVVADPALTQTGLLTGSPAYLAPEVASGRRGDQAADVWSLGATVFHVLSGRPPYDMSDSVLGGLYRVVNEEPPRLPHAGRLAPLLEHTMVKDPSQRWTMERVRDFLGEQRDAAGADGTDTSRPAARPDEEHVPGATQSVDAGRAATDRRGHPTTRVVGLVVLVVAVVAAGVLLTVGRNEGADQQRAGAPASPTEATSDASGGPSRSSEPGPSSQPGASKEPAAAVRSSGAAGPTRRGMEQFVRDYVRAVSTDPDAAWQMLTPRFQAQSGGLATYRDFWAGVGPGRILEISANPDTLVVSYRVRFENFGTGRRPTVLELEYADGRYRIDGERTEGFVPAD